MSLMLALNGGRSLIRNSSAMSSSMFHTSSVYMEALKVLKYILFFLDFYEYIYVYIYIYICMYIGSSISRDDSWSSQRVI